MKILFLNYKKKSIYKTNTQNFQKFKKTRKIYLKKVQENEKTCRNKKEKPKAGIPPEKFSILI